MSEQFARLEIKGRALFLNGSKLKGVEKLETTVSSDIPKGKARMKMTDIVDFDYEKYKETIRELEKEG